MQVFNKKLFLSVIFSLILAVCAQAQESDYLAKGFAAAKAKDWESAIASFQEAQSKTSLDPVVLFNLGLAYDMQGGRELLAICWYKAYLAAAPKASNAKAAQERITQLDAQAEKNIRLLIQRAYDAATDLIGTGVEYKTTLSFFIDISQAQMDLGDTVAARQTLLKAKEIAKDVDDESYISQSQVYAKDIDEAIKTALFAQNQMSEKPDVGSQALQYIADKQLDNNDLDGVKKIAGLIKDRYEKYKATLNLLWLEIKNAKITPAQAKAKITEQVRDDFEYVMFAKAQAEADDITGAKETAALINPSSTELAATLKDIANFQIGKNDLTGALATLTQACEALTKVKEADAKSDLTLLLYCSIAESQLNAGDLKASLKTLDLVKEMKAKLDDPYLTLRRCWLKMQIQIRSGNLTDALPTQEEIEQIAASGNSGNTLDRFTWYADIARVQAMAGDIIASRRSLAAANYTASRYHHPAPYRYKDTVCSYLEIAKAWRATTKDDETLFWADCPRGFTLGPEDTHLVDFPQWPVFLAQVRDMPLAKSVEALVATARDLSGIILYIRNWDKEWQKYQ